MSKKFDAILAKNNLAQLLHEIAAGEFESIQELPLGQMRFDLREIEIYIGEGNQPSIADIIEAED